MPLPQGYELDPEPQQQTKGPPSGYTLDQPDRKAPPSGYQIDQPAPPAPPRNWKADAAAGAVNFAKGYGRGLLSDLNKAANLAIPQRSGPISDWVAQQAAAPSSGAAESVGRFGGEVTPFAISPGGWPVRVAMGAASGGLESGSLSGAALGAVTSVIGGEAMGRLVGRFGYHTVVEMVSAAFGGAPRALHWALHLSGLGHKVGDVMGALFRSRAAPGAWGNLAGRAVAQPENQDGQETPPVPQTEGQTR